MKAYVSFRHKVRNGPLYSVLDPSSFTDDKGKVDKRAGFDPFNDQESYTFKLLEKKRTIPDMTGFTPALQFYPKELWHTVDPKRKHALWKSVDGPLVGGRSKKRKRPLPTNVEAGQAQHEEQQNSDEDSDVVVTGRRKHNAAKSRKTDPTTKAAKQKTGLDAEDDYPDADPDNDEDGDVDDVPQDSEFDDSDDDGDDYNAEQYFDGGDDEDFGGDEGGGDEDAWM